MRIGSTFFDNYANSYKTYWEYTAHAALINIGLHLNSYFVLIQSATFTSLLGFFRFFGQMLVVIYRSILRLLVVFYTKILLVVCIF